MLNFPSSLFFFLFLFSSLFILQVSSGSQEITETVLVDPNGHGNFTKIQEAIDSIPDGNEQWIKIHLSTGVFEEKVNIGGIKGFIILEGEGVHNTVIQWGDHHSPSSIVMELMDQPNHTWLTATFVSLAHNVILSGITFKNTYLSRTDVQIGVAAIIGGDKTSVYSCNFIGVQDTLSDLAGRHYFKDCYVEGAMDFIFGSGQSIYQDCRLSTVRSSKSVGYVTAQGRSDENDKSGFVFKNCILAGSGRTFLGRAWRNYSRVLFYQTYMQDIVVPEGWNSWEAADGGIHTTFAEHGCSGPGSNTSGRVPWEKQLSNDEVMQLADISYIDDDGWLHQQPVGYSY